MVACGAAVGCAAIVVGLVRVVLDDLRGALDDGENIVEVVRDSRGERAERIHLLAMQKFARGDFQLAGAFGNFLFHGGMAQN